MLYSFEKEDFVLNPILLTTVTNVVIFLRVCGPENEYNSHNKHL